MKRKRKEMGFAMGLTGHTFGVTVLKMDRPAAGGFLGLTAFQAEGCGLPLCGNAYEVSVTGLVSLSYGKISITSISHLRWLSPLWCLTAPPSPR